MWFGFCLHLNFSSHRGTQRACVAVPARVRKLVSSEWMVDVMDCCAELRAQRHAGEMPWGDRRDRCAAYRLQHLVSLLELNGRLSKDHHERKNCQLTASVTDDAVADLLRLRTLEPSTPSKSRSQPVVTVASVIATLVREYIWPFFEVESLSARSVFIASLFHSLLLLVRHRGCPCPIIC